MAPIHRRRLTEAKLKATIRGLEQAKRAVTISAIARETNTPFDDAKARLVECNLLPASRQPQELTKEALEAAIASLREAGKPPSILGVAQLLKLKPGFVTRAWRAHGYQVTRGRPKTPPKNDPINADILSRKYDDREIARRHKRTPWAIVLRRRRLGLPPYIDSRKAMAYDLLLNGEGAGIVAIKTGFERLTVQGWRNELITDPLCLVKGCCRKAIYKRTETDIAPSICRKCHNA